VTNAHKFAYVLSALTLSCWFTTASAQEPVSPSNIPAKVIASTRRIEVAADGSSRTDLHTETKLLKQNAVGPLSQTAIGYSDLLQQLDVTDAYTLKADGQKIPVAPDAIITQQSPNSRNSPLLSDQKQKVIIFPNVEVGDTLVYNADITSKAQIENNFVYDAVIPSALAIDDGTLILSLPRSMAPIMETRSINPTKKNDGDRVVYTLHYSNTKPTMPSKIQSPYDLSPRFSLSTFKDYDALANAYSALALPSITVTPAIQAKADEITAGITDRKEQAHKIYDWVAMHVRYVAIELGQGGIVPHSADHVLTDVYGDCKDHAVLFAALLKAKGIDSNLVLINGANTYTLGKAPTLAPFNHMIVWLPAFHLYADTTAGRIMPFGLLPLPEYGKPVIHIGDSAGALHQTPLTDTNSSSVAYKLTIVADDQGRISSHSSITAAGDFANALKVLGVLVQGQDSTELAAKVLQKGPTPHATGSLTAPPPDMDATSYEITGTYSTPGAVLGLAQGTGMPMEDSLRIANPFSGLFFGSIVDGQNREADAVPCYNGHAIDDETLQYSNVRHLVRVPEDSKVSREHVSYSSHWSTDGNSVTVHRELTTHFDTPLCSGSEKDELVALSDQTKTDRRTVIMFQHDSKGNGSSPN
jgi:transglutaminase-like putative cysteine protease